MKLVEDDLPVVGDKAYSFIIDVAVSSTTFEGLPLLMRKVCVLINCKTCIILIYFTLRSVESELY